MAKTFGDESGILWDKQVYVGRSASKGTLKGGKLPAPVNYQPPSYRSILDCPRVSLDIETCDPNLESKGSGVYRKDGFILGVAVDYGDGDRRYYPIRHATGENLNEQEFLRTLATEARDFSGTLINANLQYDLDWLYSEGVDFKSCKFFDVQFAEPLLDENMLSYKLQHIAMRRLGRGKETSTLESHYGDDFIKHLKDIHPFYVGEYACTDVDLPMQLMDIQLPILEREGLLELCQLEHDLIPLLLQMRRTGVCVDVRAAENAMSMCVEESAKVAQRLRDMVGFEVETFSADSVARGFDKLGIAYPLTSRGKPSFTKPWLEAHPSEFARSIVEIREFNKISGTFIRNYILEGHVDGRIHCSFNPLRGENGGTVSGRFSSSGPNLQNIPARHPVLGPMCRAIFIPEHDCDWGSVDWSQIEFRFLVHYAVAAKCPGAEIAANLYRTDKSADFHEMASSITGKPRGTAKNINFGVVYGMGESTMASNLGTSVEEAAPVLKEFHRRLPWLKQIYNKASDRAAKNGFIKTILGRRRRFDMFEKGYGGDRSLIPEAQYEALAPRERREYRRAFTHKALNSLLQGSAADLMKKSMVKAYNDGVFNTLIPHLTVHDEMDVSVPRTSEGAEAFKELIYTMEHTMELNVPVHASAKTGQNWSECK